MRNVKKNFKSQKSQRGDFLVTLMIAIVIVAIIGATAYANMRDSNRDVQIDESIKKVVLTANALRANFGVTGQYGTVTTAIAVQTGSIPTDQRIAGTNTAQNAFGGAVTATPVQLTSTNDALELSWANVPAWACSRIVIGTQSAARRITVGGTAVKPTDAALLPATLTQQCDVNAPVTIVWAIGRTGA